jgi:hypothetical protein
MGISGRERIARNCIRSHPCCGSAVEASLPNPHPPAPDVFSASERNQPHFSPRHNPNTFFAFSAMMHSENVTTPLLVLHGAADESVPTY